MKAIYLCDSRENVANVYSEKQKKMISEMVEITDRVYSLEDARNCPEVRDTEIIFSTWGMPRIEKDEIGEIFPKLRAVFYGAGSVQGFAGPFIEKGIKVFSAWVANGVPVAEYTVAQIALAAKGFFRLQQLMHENRLSARAEMENYPGMYDIKIGLLGLGAIGARVAEMLKAYDVEVLAFDPFASDEKMAALGAERASMEEIFASCDIVSNHLANRPETQKIIKREYFMSMKDHSTFINTGRGMQLDEKDLTDLLVKKPTVTAVLDVLIDEENSNSNPLNDLPNCFITPHIAGSMGNEVRRMAAYMADECARWLEGRELRYEVTAEMLKTMA